jgi:hypothetical protein
VASPESPPPATITRCSSTHARPQTVPSGHAPRRSPMKTPEQLTHKATHHRRHRGREVFRAFATASGTGSGSSPLRAVGERGDAAHAEFAVAGCVQRRKCTLAPADIAGLLVVNCRLSVLPGTPDIGRWTARRRCCRYDSVSRADARLRAARHHNPVRGVGGCHWQGDRRLLPAASPRGVLEVPRAGREDLPTAQAAHRMRQPLACS